MPAKPPKDAIVIALDIGKSVSTLHDCEENTFFKLARDCVSWIIQRKIISQSADVLSLLLIGSNESENSMASKGYKNVTVKFDFQQASWDMLKFIETEVETTYIESDWCGALIVSLEMLKTYEEYNAIGTKKIVIFSDFTKPASDDFTVIIKTMKALVFEVTIIGPDHLQFSGECDDLDEPKVKKTKTGKNLERQEGERMVYEMWKKLPQNIWLCTFESALKQLCSYTPKPRRVNYWNCMMEIGEVNINISMVKKTDPKPARKFNLKSVKPDKQEPNQNTCKQGSAIKSEKTAAAIRDLVMHYKHETGQNDEVIDVEVKPEDTIEGFRYGTTIVPFSEEDKSAMQYNPGPKSFSIVGFTRISNVPYYLLSGECSYLVVARDKDKNAEIALSALVQGMKKLECLAIVRKVYSDNWGLSLGILYPMVQEIISDETDDVSYQECLLFIELAFADDLISVDFPSLKQIGKEINKKQYDAIDSLIDGMDLMKADKGLRGEPCEAFSIPFLHDSKEQFFNYCVIQKGLYPDKPLPSSLPPYIKNFTKTPRLIEKNCASIFKEIKKQFEIKKLDSNNVNANECNKREIGEQSDLNKNLQRDSGEKIEHFSESFINDDPNDITRTWLRLFAKGFPTNEELDKAFSAFSEVGESKQTQVSQSFGVVITLIRAMYLKCKPDNYNRWMVSFKKYLNGKQGIAPKIWEILVIEFTGLISKKENKNSRVTEEEAEEFLCIDINKTKLAGVQQTPDYKLLDQLQAEQMDIKFD